MTSRFNPALLVLRLALTAGVVAASDAAWSVEGTIHLAPRFAPLAAEGGFEQTPSDAEIPQDWRKRVEAGCGEQPQAAASAAD